MRTPVDKITQRRVGMANNLTQCIENSGMTVTEVAAAKGVTPETLRRHRNGKIQMTLKDAEHYARILDVTVQRVLFESKPIPVIGQCVIGEELVTRTLHEPQQYEVYVDYTFPIPRVAWLWNTEKPYQGQWYDWDGAVSFTKRDPIVDKFVDPDCFQYISIVKGQGKSKKCTEPFITSGVLYPQPHNLYTVHNGKTGETYRDVDLEWATPVLSAVFRPDLCGVHVHKIGK
jgi:transcriptional regulator with XRE-family HTH domain